MLGKIIICLEEMPTSNKSDWHSVSDYIKDVITGMTLDIEKKFEDAIQIINLISLIILTNNENTIKFGKDVRRYHMLDVSHDCVGDTEYFKKLSNCLNAEAGEAFFMYLTEHYEQIKFKFDETIIPMTEAKLSIKDKNATPLIKFIKSEYVECKASIPLMKLIDLKTTFNTKVNKDYSTQTFKTMLMTDLPIIKIKEDSKNGHKLLPLEHSELLNWYVKKGFWNCKFDMFDGEQLILADEVFNEKAVNEYKEKYDDLLIKYNELVLSKTTNKNIILDTVTTINECIKPEEVIIQPVKIKKSKKAVAVVEAIPVSYTHQTLPTKRIG